MQGFKVVLNGKNFHIKMQENTKVLGFYAIRFIEAEQSEDAQKKAMELVMNDKKLLESMRNPPKNSPEIHVDEVVQCTITEENLKQNHVFSFYEGE